MSIVGPRPQLVRDMIFMTDDQRRRHGWRKGKLLKFVLRLCSICSKVGVLITVIVPETQANLIRLWLCILNSSGSDQKDACLVSKTAKGAMLMGYRRVSCLEQCWYIIRFWVKEKIKNLKDRFKNRNKNIITKRRNRT